MRRLRDLTVNDIAGAAVAPGNIPAAIMLSRTEPAERSAGARLKSGQGLEDAMIFEMGRKGDLPMPVIAEPNLQTPTDRLEAATDLLLGQTSKYASNNRATFTDPSGKSTVAEQISINPNVDEAFLFHELGHIANRQGGLGKAVRDARDNGDLQKALLIASAIAPGAVTALTPGDDDAGAALLASGAAYAPVLADELMATNTGLRMMETAGTRATLGQRGRLAGSLLSYLAPVIGTAAISGVVGNQFD